MCARPPLGKMDCKQALSEVLVLQTRQVQEGRVEAYIHHSGKIGVLVDVNTATDFAANSTDFREFVRNLTMHIAAAWPRTGTFPLENVHLLDRDRT